MGYTFLVECWENVAFLNGDRYHWVVHYTGESLFKAMYKLFLLRYKGYSTIRFNWR